MTQAEKNYREAERLKMERAQHLEMKQLQQENELRKNENMKNMV